MPTTVIRNSCFAGALEAILTGRYVGGQTLANYALACNMADAIAAEFLVINTASGSPLDDTNNAQIGALVGSVAAGTVTAMGPISVNAGDYVAIAGQIWASAKQGLTKLL